MLSVWQFSELPSGAPGTVPSISAVTGDNDPSAVAGTAVGAFDELQSLRIEADITGNAGGSLDVYVQSYWLGHWYDLAHFPTVPAGAALTRYAFVAGPAYLQTAQIFGVDLQPALAANTILGGPWGEKLRLVMVSGAGTSGFGAVVCRIIGQRPVMVRT